MKLTTTKKGIRYVLKVCPGCGDEWYVKRKQNKCTLCGAGLIMRTKENHNKNWDEVNPQKTSELNSFENLLNSCG